MDYSPPMLRLLSVCQVGDCCKLLLDGIDILKWIRYPNYKLSLIKVVLCVSYFVSGLEIWFHSTFIFSTKNSASSSSGINDDSRSRYSAISHQYHHSHWIDQAFQYALGFLHIVPLHCLISEFSHTHCHKPLSRLTSSLNEQLLRVIIGYESSPRQVNAGL